MTRMEGGKVNKTIDAIRDDKNFQSVNDKNVVPNVVHQEVT